MRVCVCLCVCVCVCVCVAERRTPVRAMHLLGVDGERLLLDEVVALCAQPAHARALDGLLPQHLHGGCGCWGGGKGAADGRRSALKKEREREEKRKGKSAHGTLFEIISLFLSLSLSLSLFLSEIER